MVLITLKENITIKQSFKDISESNWNKVILNCRGWGADKGFLNKENFFNSIVLNNPKFGGYTFGTNRYSFASEEVVKDVKEVFPNAKDLILSPSKTAFGGGEGFAPGQVFGSLLSGIDNVAAKYRSNHLFINLVEGGFRCKIRSLKVLQFLRKYCNDYTFDVIYLKGESFDDSEPAIAAAIASNPGAWIPTNTNPSWSHPVSNRNLLVNTNQQWLEANYPKDQRKDLKELNIADKNLEGELDLSDFTSLEKLLCYGNNKITKLILPSQNNLEWIDAGYNSLTDLDFLNNLDPNKLKGLKIHQNNIQEQDLSCFSRFTNLTDLAIGNCYNYGGVEAIDKGNYNNFFGSLQPLQNLSRLENLAIWNSNIDSGLEHLPENLKTIHCSNEGPANWKCKNLLDQLEKHNMSNIEKDSYNYQSWLTQTKDSIVSGQN